MCRLQVQYYIFDNLRFRLIMTPPPPPALFCKDCSQSAIFNLIIEVLLICCHLRLNTNSCTCSAVLRRSAKRKDSIITPSSLGGLVTQPRSCFQVCRLQGLKLRPIQSHLRLKYLEKSQICDLFSSSLFRNKRVTSCHFPALFTKLNEEMTKLFCFSP